MITISVTAEHIAQGKVLSCYSGFLAYALKAVGFRSVVVYSDSVYCQRTANGVVYTALLPPAVADKVRRFNAGEPIEPFTFQLAIPPA